jgi:hypothetical protein
VIGNLVGAQEQRADVRVVHRQIDAVVGAAQVLVAIAKIGGSTSARSMATNGEYGRTASPTGLNAYRDRSW